jgi:uncharacterized protein (TIGR02300 family)
MAAPVNARPWGRLEAGSAESVADLLLTSPQAHVRPPADFYTSRIAMATKQARGTKRTCQNPECGSRFYDLDRDPIVCPICESTYAIASAPMTAAAAPQVEEHKAKKPEFAEEVAAAPEPEVESTEALAEIEAGEEAVADEGDETFLEEEEEDGGDVSGIIGGTVAGNEEET